MADETKQRPGPHWHIPPHIFDELARRRTAAGDAFTGVDVRTDSTKYGEPMTLDVRSKGDDALGASRVTPLNDTFKCPPICS